EQFKKIAEKQPTPKPGATDEETGSSNAERLFGMQLQDLTGDLADALGYAAGHGVLISAVDPDSPAGQVGMERGLVIYRIGKFDVNSVKQAEDILSHADGGSRVDFTVGIVGRGGSGRRIQTVELEAR
ncbi:MAG: hypothetical protein ACREFG_11060, partial [Chthoniobacterales bacterium]